MSRDRLLSIVGLGAAFRSGQSPVAIVQACLDRIAERNASIRAMIFVDADGALAAARQAEAELRAGRDRGPLHGVPIAIKDMIDVAGWPTTAGSRLFGDAPAARDAACVTRLRAAGAVILGKTNQHELTVGDHDNPWFGKVVNPFDSTRGTAGTSSGSAAAVAAGFCAAAIGSDTGGSNRSVAAATGLFGFKPTNGAVDPAGSLPTAATLDCLGPIATSIADIRLMTEAMMARALRRDGPARAQRITIALCPELYGAEVDGVVERALDEWLRKRRAAGATIVERPFRSRQVFIEAGLTILMYEFARRYEKEIEANPARTGDAVRAFLQQAQGVDAASYAEALRLRQESIARLEDLMDGVDILAAPTSPGLAPRLSDEKTSVRGSDTPFGLAGGAFRRWANMLGMPTLATPIPSGERFPASIQLAARPGRDAALLDMAEALVHAAAHGQADANINGSEP